MKNLLFLLTFALFATIAGAQTTTYDGLTVHTTITHPLLYGFSNSTALSNARTWYAANHSSYTPSCTNYNDYLNCEQTAFAHLMTVNGGSPVDCSAAITLTTSTMQSTINSGVITAGGQPGINAEIDFGETMIMVYDWCYDQFTSAQKSTFIQGANIWFGPTLGGNSGGIIGDTCPNGIQGNLCWGILRNALEWGVVGYAEDTSIAQQDLDWWAAKWSYFINYSALSGAGGNGGGVPQEGMGYGQSMWSTFGPDGPLLTAKAAGRDLMKESNWFLETLFTAIYGTLPAPTFTSSDSSNVYDIFPFNDDSSNPFLLPNNVVRTTDLPDIVANEYAGTNAAGYIRTWLNTLTPSQSPLMWFVAAQDAGGSAVSYSGLPLDYYAAGSGFMWMRHAWDTSTVAHLEMNTPSEVGHHHAWPGSWQMWRGGRWLSRETMGYSETFTGWNSTSSVGNSQSATMNEILVNPDNQGCTPYLPTQQSGATCQGDGGEWNGIVSSGGADNQGAQNPYINAQPSRLETQSAYAYAAVDLSGSYYQGGYDPYFGKQGYAENPAVQTVVREFVWVRDLETLVVFDRVLTLDLNGILAASMKRTFLAHCEYNWTLVDSNHAACVDGTQELALTTLLPATPNPAYHVTNEQTANSDPNGQYRLEVDDTPGTAQSYFAHVLQGMATTGTKLNPTIADNGTSYTITLDSNHSITFNKGATSSGGSITINGAATNFTSSVEPITVTTAGPVWGGTSGPTLTSIAVTPATASVVAGKTQQFTATCHYSDSSSSNCTSTVTWLTSNAGLATVTSNGLATGLSAGSPTITAISGSVTGSSTLTVTPPTVTGIAVTPATASIAAGTGTQQYAAQCSYSNNTDSDCTSTVTWSSSNTSAATISSAGLASGVTAGSTTIEATSGNVSGSGALTVNAPSLTVTTTSLTQAVVGSSYSFQLTAAGGVAPYAWALTSGTLPAGLSLSASGIISGTPTTPISATPLTFRVTDANSVTSLSSGLVLTVASTGAAGNNQLDGGMWGWMGGNYLASTSSGTPSSGSPSGREAPATWSDGNGDLWIFGGGGVDSAGVDGYLNDLWEFVPSAAKWALVAGSNTVPAANTGQSGVYGTLGTPASGNIPGGREASTSWTDKTGNLWLFGGLGYDSAGANGSLNDLWEFNASTQQWTWMGGSSTVPGANEGRQGVYGQLGVPSGTNTPGGRCGASSWTDSDGNLWLFGGIGYDSTGSLGALNDLWELNPTTGKWAWIGGSSTVGSNGGQPGTYGSYQAPSKTSVPSGRSQAVSWTGSDGNLWLFGGDGFDSTGTAGYLNDLWEFNPSTQEWAWMGGSSTVGCTGCGNAGTYGTLGESDSANGPGGRSQALGWTDSNGDLWLLGGNGYDSVGANGILNDLWEFIPSTLEWAWIDGSSTIPGPKKGLPGVYGVLGVPAAADTPGSRSGSGGWSDNYGNLWLFGGLGVDSSGNYGNLSDLWVFQPTPGNLPATTPVISVASGTYNTTQTVTITDSTPNAIIYYTTNGTTPTTGSSVYTSPVTVSADATLEAIAVAKQYKASAEASAAYKIIPFFSIAAAAGSATSATISPGAAATFNMVITPMGGATLPAAISLTANGLPPGATAKFNPSTVAAGMGTTNVTLSVQTSSTSASLVRDESPWTIALCLLFLPFAIPRRGKSRRRLSFARRLLAGILLLTGAGIVMSGCSGTVAVNKTGTGTPTTYNVTVSAASGSLNQTTTFAVTVQ